MKATRLLFLFLAVLVLGFNVNVFATTYYVDKATGDDVNNTGLSWLKPFKTINRAVTASATNDIIKVKANTYTETLNLIKNITIEGIGTCILDGQNGTDATILAFEYCKLINFTIKNMNSDTWPAVGLYAGGYVSGLKLDGTNDTQGGIFVESNYSNLQTVVASCTVTDGHIFGIKVGNGYDNPNGLAILVSKCTARSNSGNGFIFERLRQIDKVSEIISQGNNATMGAGVNCYLCSYLKIYNALITGNRLGLMANMSYKGAGIYFYGTANSTLELNSSTIASNLGNKLEEGQAIYMADYCNLKMLNSIVYYNANSFNYNYPISVMDTSYADIDYSCVPYIDLTSGNIPYIPEFANPVIPSPTTVPTTGGDYHLLSYSPCINTGNPLTGLIPGYVTRDLDSKTRIINTRIDMGCYEYGTSGIPIESITPNTSEISKASIEIFPNPVTSESKLIITSNEAENYLITIYSSTGQNISENNVSGRKGQTSINLSELGIRSYSPGYYLVKIQASGFSQTLKFVIN